MSLSQAGRRSQGRRTGSADRTGKRPSAQRCSIATLRPGIAGFEPATTLIKVAWSHRPSPVTERCQNRLKLKL